MKRLGHGLSRKREIIATKMAYDDASYYQRRAEQEIELAQRAAHRQAVQAHYRLASAYLDLIHGDTPERAPGLFDS